MGRAMVTLPARATDDSTTTSSNRRRRRRNSRLGPLPLLLLTTAITAAAAATAPTPPAEPPRPSASSLARRRGPPLAIPPGLGQDNVHTVFLTDCTAYSDWQTLTLIFSWRESGQPGPLTRVMCCTPEEAARYSGAMLSLVPTHVAPSLTKNPHNNDTYAAYNKPGAIIDWLAHFTPREEFLLVMDSDMILRHPFLPGRFPMVRPGWAASGKYDYLAGVYNELADTFVPNVVPRDDELAGPKGRRADQVGGFFFTRVDDIRKVSTEWLSLSEAVRFDPTAWRTTGDAFSKTPGSKPWISEMYGYAFSAARHGVWHTWTPSAMLYPGYVPEGVPLLLHYGLEISVRIPDPSVDDAQLELARQAAEADAIGEVDDDGGDGRDEIVSIARLARETEAPPSTDDPAEDEAVAMLAAADAANAAADDKAGAKGKGVAGGKSTPTAPSTGRRYYIWSWDKHSFTRHNVTHCPPWKVVGKRPPHGLFAQPPLPDMLDPTEEPLERYTNLIAIETVHTANAAMCEWFLSQCPTKKGDWLRRRCARVRRGYDKVKAALREWDARFACADFYNGCPAWSQSGECEKNAKFMLYNCQLSCKVCSPPPAAPPHGTYMPIALVGLPPGTVGATTAADVLRGAAAAAAAADDAAGGAADATPTPRDTASVVEAIIDPLAPEASEGSAPGEGVHPERRLRKERFERAKKELEQRRQREAERREKQAASESAAALRRRGWLWRLSHPRESLALAVAVLDDVASGERAAGGGSAAAEPEREVGDAPGLIAPQRAKRLRTLYSPAPATMSRDDLMRHCHAQLLSGSMAELADCTDSARLGLAYLTADEREEAEARAALEGGGEDEDDEEDDEDDEEGGGKKGKQRGGGMFGWARRRRRQQPPQQQREGRRTVAGAATEEEEQGERHEQAQAGRRPPPRPRQAVGRAPGAAADGDAAVKPRRSRASTVLALMGWLAGLALLTQIFPYLWRRASPRLRARIIRHVKSKGDA